MIRLSGLEEMLRARKAKLGAYIMCTPYRGLHRIRHLTTILPSPITVQRKLGDATATSHGDDFAINHSKRTRGAA